MEKALKSKVLVYCVSDGKLLVFRHVDFSSEEVGLQVPAGSIRPNETPEEAAFRELCEETGRTEFVVEEFLGSTYYDISPYRHEVQLRYFYRARPTAALPDRWQSAEDHDGNQPPTRLECFWVPLEAAHVLQAGQSSLLWRLAK